jgi:hypothetical protein
MKCKGRCDWDQGMNYECVHILVQICCYNKCGIIPQEFNPHLPKVHGHTLRKMQTLLKQFGQA